MSEKGIFVISLDFELNWGVHDRFPNERYRKNLLGAREVIPILLQRFKEHQIHATWAIVGLLFFSKKEQMVKEIPDLLPDYDDIKLSAYAHMKNIGLNEMEDPIHYGSSLVKLIQKESTQEIASHTFSHYYCLAKGQNQKAFEADTKQAIKVAKRKGLPAMNSIVFPRNQINTHYLETCKQLGITVYRGCEDHWLYKVIHKKDGLLKRTIRLLDSYINISGHHIYGIESLLETNGMVNIPSSRFLRPYSKRLRYLEPIKLNRIKMAMTKAAQEGRVFHLWWHPHNFGICMKENLQVLDSVIDHFLTLQEQYGMKSMSMNEVREKLILEQTSISYYK
ncbi:polysaccharide deacetylase family protein [Ornithinibacillus scapharcae]|uniref:polysaccharide deacetylase family protein n=1 Tax=Ornithinibacillus scapharcae TaxID=1147159 RepID=UPI000225B2D5|nr:polysaccharide deacetylase family protein [Ornithinibacillus scapharcae]